MTNLPQLPDDIMNFCRECRKGLRGLYHNDDRIAFLRDILPTLLHKRPLFKELLTNIVTGAEYPDINYPTMFDTEIILYNDPERLFSLRMFIWAPGAYDPIHDHNSWGVIGPASGKLEVINYRRLDNGDREGYAHLTETDRQIILPGETYFVQPLNAGIHKTGNPHEETIIQLSVYGKSQIKRNHINGFDPANYQVYPIYAPKVKKKLLAAQALPLLEN